MPVRAIVRAHVFTSWATVLFSLILNRRLPGDGTSRAI